MFFTFPFFLKFHWFTQAWHRRSPPLHQPAGQWSCRRLAGCSPHLYFICIFICILLWGVVFLYFLYLHLYLYVSLFVLLFACFFICVFYYIIPLSGQSEIPAACQHVLKRLPSATAQPSAPPQREEPFPPPMLSEAHDYIYYNCNCNYKLEL